MDARSSTIRDAPTRVTNQNMTGGVPKPSARRAGRRDRPVILVVEDDPDDREIYGRILYYNGFDVIFAADAAGAIELACSHAPDLILLDLGLPSGSGLDVCVELRRRSECEDTPVIALSGFPETEMGVRARQAGCSEYIEKPASPVVVLHAVEAMIGKAPLPGVGRPPVVLE